LLAGVAVVHVEAEDLTHEGVLVLGVALGALPFTILPFFTGSSTSLPAPPSPTESRGTIRPKGHTPAVVVEVGHVDFEHHALATAVPHCRR